MGILDWLILAVLAAAIVLAVRRLRIRKKTGCSCGCAGCTASCSGRTEKQRGERN